MFVRFDENPAMTLQVIKETKRYGRTDARTDTVKTVYPPQTKFTGDIKMYYLIVFYESIVESCYKLFKVGPPLTKLPGSTHAKNVIDSEEQTD